MTHVTTLPQDYRVTCTQGVDYVVDNGPQTEDTLISMLMDGVVLGPDSGETDVYFIVQVTAELLAPNSGPQDIIPDRPIYVATG